MAGEETTYKARKILVENYAIAPELLEYKLFQVIKPLDNDVQVAVHNDIMFDVQLMVGNAMKELVEKFAQAIILIGRAEVLKDGNG